MIRTSLAAAVAVLALLGACSGDDPKPDIADPTPTSTEASESATVSTSPSETATPALGPEATVRAWVEARNHALQNGDTSAAEALASESCSTCEDSLDPIRQVYADGGHFETTGWKVKASKIQSQSAGRAKVATGIEYAAGRTFPDATSSPVTYDSEQHIVVFRLALETGQWRIAFIGYLS